MKNPGHQFDSYCVAFTFFFLLYLFFGNPAVDYGIVSFTYKPLYMDPNPTDLDTNHLAAPQAHLECQGGCSPDSP